MSDLLAQIIVEPGMLNVLLSGVIALQCWLVRRSFALDKKISRISQRMASCQCQLNLNVRPDEDDD